MTAANAKPLLRIHVLCLRNGAYVVRLGLGTCGHHPFHWSMHSGRNRKGAVASFTSTYADQLDGYELSFSDDNGSFSDDNGSFTAACGFLARV